MAENKSAEDYIKSADRKLKRIRQLGAKPNQRYFLIGPKKGPLSQNERLEKQALERTEVTDRATGMRMKREQKSRNTGRGGGRR